MQMYVGTVTLITLHVLSNLLAQKWPPMVSECAICRTEVVINTKGNHISVERDMKYHSPKTTV